MDAITTLYSLTGLITLSAFVPQLIALLKDRNASIALNLSTWGLFTVSSTISFIYACSHNGDSHFILCTAIGTFGNVSILGTAILRRIQCAMLATSPAFAMKKR